VHSPIRHDDSEAGDRSPLIPKANVTATMTTRSSPAFKSVFHIRTDTPIDLDRKSGSRSSLHTREKVQEGDEVLLRQALRPLRGGLGNVTREKEKSWFKPPRVRVEARPREIDQVEHDGKMRWEEAGRMMRIEQDDMQDLAVREGRGGFDLSLPVGMYDLDLGGQVGRDDSLHWDEDQVDVGLMDLDEVDYPETNFQNYHHQQDENRMMWESTLADDRMIDFNDDDDEEMVGLAELDRPMDERVDEVIDMFGTRVRDLEKEMYGRCSGGR